MAHSPHTPYLEAYGAIVGGDNERLNALAANVPNLATAAADLPDWPDSTLLEHAVWWHREDMVEALVAAGADAARPGGKERLTPLQRALDMGADTIADRLRPAVDLQTAAGLGDRVGVESRIAGADESARRRAFRWACLNGRRETALLLCPEGRFGWDDRAALVDALLYGRHLLTWDQGDTAWDWAKEQLELADPLNVFDFSARDDRGWTLADAGSAGGDERVVALIAERQRKPLRPVSPERAWRPMNSPTAERFLFACQWGQTSRVRDFLAADPTLVNARTLWNMGALYLPGAYTSEGGTATGLFLLAAGAPPFDGIAGPSWWGAVDLVAALLERGAPAEWRERRESGLLYACAATRYGEHDNYRHWLPIIEALLAAGADPDLADRFGVTPWGFAHDEVRPLLAARGAVPVARRPGVRELWARMDEPATAIRLAKTDPESLDFYDEESGCTPPLAALLAGRRDLAERLLALKTRIDLNEAAAFGEVEHLTALLDERGVHGPRAGAGPPDVPLHFAAWCGQASVVEVLLERGYSPAAMNRGDEAGKFQGLPELRRTTPLHAAAQAGRAGILARLLDAWDAHRAS